MLHNLLSTSRVNTEGRNKIGQLRDVSLNSCGGLLNNQRDSKVISLSWSHNFCLATVALSDGVAGPSYGC